MSFVTAAMLYSSLNARLSAGISVILPDPTGLLLVSLILASSRGYDYPPMPTVRAWAVEDLVRVTVAIVDAVVAVVVRVCIGRMLQHAIQINIQYKQWLQWDGKTLKTLAGAVL
ncbi:hypothetical protein Asppvi_005201 [Aspergillus pseudoviridinutans]|uniref:Uncharacterized protein n=1 Tax=Aspergillus pseudoviridinutans TaxID=1517512 RepID=A0A9P3BAE5_9EURO|nr:uncharacterized protein Asppvi_005201 [Aspergillus pseudoviridinutans]GIJ86314.1 hypothetical protein Asppvi_005201 [Aspergillus pseudoviridinutans]